MTVFNGKDWVEFEEDGEEYVRLKRSPKEEIPQPNPYSVAHLNFSKAMERDRRSCGLTNVDHECVTIDIPVVPWMRNSGTNSTKVTNGATRVVFDTVTGLLIYSRTIQNIDNGRGGYQSDTAYTLKRMSYNNEADESLFRVPAGSTLLEAAGQRTRKLAINILNLGEIFYLSVKSKDLAYGERVMASLRPRLTTISADDDLVMNAAALKARYAISYADACAAATAILSKAPLVTGDPELRAMAQNESTLKLEWIAA